MGFRPSCEQSRVAAAKQGPTTRILYGPVQLSARLALVTLGSVFTSTSWRMVEAELYTHAQPPVTTFGAERCVSATTVFLRLTRETVRAWRARIMSLARFGRTVAKSQKAGR